MDEKIEVGYRNIGAALGKEYHHKFLLYTDKEGNQRTISGWTGDERPGLSYGRMHVETNLPYDRNNPDHRDNPNAIGQKQYREEIANGADLSGTWGRMVANARSKDDKYPYDPLLQNSNTLADSVLRDVGLQEPKNDGVLGHWAPASGRQLDESVQPAVPGLGNSGRAFSAGGAPLDPQQEARLRDDPLFKQALAGLDKLGPDAGVYTNQQDKERIAGALAVQAKLNRPPLPEIQEVVPSQTNGNVFATYKNPGNDMDLLRTHVDKGEAVKQPLAENLQKLETANQQAVQPPAQEASRSIDQPSHGALGLR
ncbi:XVIPCD domain-containing protein [Xanthomonas euvesicatoria]|uniref:XVIPCD domain-containing protein n=1 Tax=Xanthomonas euvesicatoria TaxID=456327 RepID=UPI000F8CE1A3|nr:XVIPCD domain-containing protein [Xanthomonas euvesicatoria]